MKKGFVTGITGQDGAYLTALLLGKDYEVHGLVRRSSTADVSDHRLLWLGIADRAHLVDGDLTEVSGLIRTVQRVMSDEVYDLAAQSFVKSSWQHPYATTKAAADLLLGEMAEAELLAVRFRPFSHTGPGQSPAFAAQIAAVERGGREPVIRVGNLDARRDVPDVRDVIEAYLLAVTAPALPRGVVLNLASGAPRRLGDTLDVLLRPRPRGHPRRGRPRADAPERRAGDGGKRRPRPRPPRLVPVHPLGDDAPRRPRRPSPARLTRPATTAGTSSPPEPGPSR